MFENEISFICREEYLKTNPPKPEPIKFNIPNWYKELEHSVSSKTVKGCMPFLDSLTTGYLLKLPVDLSLEHNFIDDNERKSNLVSGLNPVNDLIHTMNLNLKGIDEIHPTYQLGNKCPIVHKNKDLPIQKILNPWIIKTPKNYSCLFLPPMNNTDDRFSIIPAIVDTDNFSSEINFPFVVNGDKYPILKTVIKAGTPFVQIIPFERKSWKLKIKTETKDQHQQRRYEQEKHVLHNYKQRWWTKKSWK